jgi:hypothetical protein
MQQDALRLGVAKPPIFPLPFPFWTVDRTLSINKLRKPLTQGHSMKGATLSRFLPGPLGIWTGAGSQPGETHQVSRLTMVIARWPTSEIVALTFRGHFVGAVRKAKQGPSRVRQGQESLRPGALSLAADKLKSPPSGPRDRPWGNRATPPH